MKTLQLGRTGISVPDWCLGTMTFSNQTPQDDAFRQMDMAMDAGINFFDVAEMYPVNPVKKETMGNSEKVIGNWFETTGRREEVVLATKVSGDSGFRPGGYTAESVRGAVEDSLTRLKTDYIDLYQMHWPNRGSYHFRQNWRFDASKQDKAKELDNLRGVLSVLNDLVTEGKLRAIGLSNESAWGTMQWLKLAEEGIGPRVASMQNEYSLLARMYDTDMSEVSIHEDVLLLSYSPLATGLLTGKYRNGAVPEASRMSLVPGLSGRSTPRAHAAVEAYQAIADKHGLALDHMSMAWQRSRPFPISAIFGTTTAEQLEHLLKAKDMELDGDVIKDIEAAHRDHPMPF